MTTNLQLAQKIASKVQLEVVSLRAATVETNFDPMDIPKQIGLSQQYRCTFASDHIEGQHQIRVTVDFKFFAKHVEDDVALDDAMTLDASFLLVYTASDLDGVEDHCFKHFADVNGPYNAWPYWRELVQTATGRVGLSGITIPVFRPIAVQVHHEDC